MSALFDPETGELRQQAPSCENCAAALAQAAEAEMNLRVVERRLSLTLANEAKLRAELERQRLETPEGQVASALGKYWKQRLGKSKTTKVKEKRLKAIIARLRDGYDPTYIARAIDGAAVAANTSNSEGQRQALLKVMEEAIRRVDERTAAELRDTYREAMKGTVVYDDVELICRDEVHLERFHDLAERVNAPTIVGPAWLEAFEERKHDTLQAPEEETF